MKTKNLTIAAILLALGSVLHLAVPGILGGMKGDLLLMMMFMAIFFNLNLGSTIAISIVSGIIAAMTTTFPGGQIPSIFDKTISGIFVYLVTKIYLKSRSFNSIYMFIISFLGTIISGVVFLYVALVLYGLPGGVSYSALFISIVLPTALITGVLSVVLGNILIKMNKGFGNLKI